MVRVAARVVAMVAARVALRVARVAARVVARVAVREAVRVAVREAVAKESEGGLWRGWWRGWRWRWRTSRCATTSGPKTLRLAPMSTRLSRCAPATAAPDRSCMVCGGVGSRGAWPRRRRSGDAADLALCREGVTRG